MLKGIRNFLKSNRRRQLTDPRNVGLYIFTLVVLAITWSGVKTVQNNYQLQKFWLGFTSYLGFASRKVKNCTTGNFTYDLVIPCQVFRV